jgi:Flp pilus assembly protein TadD
MLAKARPSAKSRTVVAPRLPAETGVDWVRSCQAAALVLLTLVAYSHAISNGFIWDDDYYVENNATLRTPQGLLQIWTEPRATPQYYPLVHTTFWIEYRLWGLRPAGYHLVNVLLHATTALLLWRLLARLAVPGAWLAAAVFAVHPVEVESVAWITERKNVLSAALALAAMLAYLRFSPADAADIKSDGAHTQRQWRWYPLSLGLYIAALLGKTMTASVPAVLLVIYWWKRGRIALSDVARLVPFFAIGAALAGVTAWLERTQVGATGGEFELSAAARVVIAGRALWFYAAKLLWPVELNFFYPRWHLDPTEWWQWLYPTAALAVVVALWLARRRIGRGPLAAVLIFAGVLVPALGFFNVYPFRYSYVADHFQYHASMALIALAAAGVVLAAARLPPGAWTIASVLGASVLAILAGLTWQRTHIYEDQFVLFTDVVARDPQSFIGHHNLGTLYLRAHEPELAIPHLKEATQIEPTYLEARNSLASALAETGDCGEAIRQLEIALETPDAPTAHRALSYNNLAWNLATCADPRYRDPPRAVAMAEKALELAPKMGPYWSTLAAAQYRAGQFEEAVQSLTKSIELRSGADCAELYFLAMALWQLGRQNEARRWFDEATQLRAEHQLDDAESARLEAEAAQLLYSR